MLRSHVDVRYRARGAVKSSALTVHPNTRAYVPDTSLRIRVGVPHQRCNHGRLLCSPVHSPTHTHMRRTRPLYTRRGTARKHTHSPTHTQKRQTHPSICAQGYCSQTHARTHTHTPNPLLHIRAGVPHQQAQHAGQALRQVFPLECRPGRAPPPLPLPRPRCCVRPCFRPLLLGCFRLEGPAGAD